jgi:hypothetical protein
MADLTHLDKAALQAFVDGDLHDFISQLTAIRQDDPNGAWALRSLVEGETTPTTLQQNPILAIGTMAGDDTAKGQTLIAKIKTNATAVDKVLKDQGTLFGDIDSDLRETITTLLNTQGGSLESIAGAKLLDIFSDVDGDLGTSGATPQPS